MPFIQKYLVIRFILANYTPLRMILICSLDFQRERLGRNFGFKCHYFQFCNRRYGYILRFPVFKKLGKNLTDQILG